MIHSLFGEKKNVGDSHLHFAHHLALSFYTLSSSNLICSILDNTFDNAKFENDFPDPTQRKQHLVKILFKVKASLIEDPTLGLFACLLVSSFSNHNTPERRKIPNPWDLLQSPLPEDYDEYNQNNFGDILCRKLKQLVNPSLELKNYPVKLFQPVKASLTVQP